MTQEERDIANEEKRTWLEETARCPECGQTPDEGACFYCKMD